MYKENKQKRHNTVTKLLGSNFCAAPWTSFWESPQGNVTFCCMSRESLGNTNDSPMEEILDSPQARTVRASLLRNEMPQYCSNCFKNKDNVIDNNAKGWNQIFHAVANTESDGKLNGNYIEWADLNFSNKCNFACLGCTPELSDTIKRKYMPAYASLTEKTSEGHAKNWEHLPDDTVFANNSSTIDYIVNNAFSMSRIHLNGGEPWMQEGFYQLLDKLIVGGQHKSITLWTHTNGSISTWNRRNFIDEYLSIWHDAQVSMSCDGVGARGEYIRFGYTDRKWRKTYDKIQFLNKTRDNPINVTVQFSVNTFNILTLSSHIKEISEYIDTNSTVSIELWRDDYIRSIAGAARISEQFRIRALAELEKVEKITNHTRRFALRPSIRDVLEDPHRNNASAHDSGTPVTERCRYFLDAINKLDAMRSTDFASTFPELDFLIQEIKQIVAQTDQTHSHTS